jgi:hypothetical protein
MKWYDYEDPDFIADPSTTTGSKQGLVYVADAGENNINFEKLLNSHNQWLLLEHIEVGPDGRQAVTYPFLKDKHNIHDHYLIRQVAMTEPYKMKYGKTGPVNIFKQQSMKVILFCRRVGA